MIEPVHDPDLSILSVSIFLVIIGAFLGAALSNIFGRKKTLLGASIFVIPRVICFLFLDEDWMRFVQILTEIGSGFTCTVVPLYISEVAGTNNRGPLMITQLLTQAFGTCIVTGALAISNHSEIGSINNIIYGIVLGIGVLFHVIVIAFFPETPHYLNMKEKYQEAAHSLAFFRGMSHVKIREEATELQTTNTYTNRSRQVCCGKVGQLFQFANRRSLAIIFSLIALRWAAGQHRNEGILWDWVLYYEKNYMSYVFLGIFGLQLFFSAFITLTIDIFKRKISILLVILVSMIAAIVGMVTLGGENTLKRYWILFGVFIVQEFGCFIIIGVTLAYVGQLFATNVRGLAIATVISFEILIRNVIVVFENKAFFAGFDIGYGQLISFCNGPVYFVSLLFILIFFPRINKVPCSEIIIENPPGASNLLS